MDKQFEASKTKKDEVIDFLKVMIGTVEKADHACMVDMSMTRGVVEVEPEPGDSCWRRFKPDEETIISFEIKLIKGGGDV